MPWRQLASPCVGSSAEHAAPHASDVEAHMIAFDMPSRCDIRAVPCRSSHRQSADMSIRSLPPPYDTLSRDSQCAMMQGCTEQFSVEQSTNGRAITGRCCGKGRSSRPSTPQACIQRCCSSESAHTNTQKQDVSHVVGRPIGTTRVFVLELCGPTGQYPATRHCNAVVVGKLRSLHSGSFGLMLMV